MATIEPVFNGTFYTIERVSRPVAGLRENAQGRAPADTDRVELSPEARQKAKEASSKDAKGNAAVDGLSEGERKEVDSLKQRDQEVRVHESAHIMAGGALVRGGATYSYRTGPDGKRYAVGGEVQIDTSPVDGDPRATLRKAQQIRKAAMAPAQPSGQDQAVASAAASMETNAQRELADQTQAKSGGGSAATGKPAQKTEGLGGVNKSV
jgi:hypothetical protein